MQHIAAPVAAVPDSGDRRGGTDGIREPVSLTEVYVHTTSRFDPDVAVILASIDQRRRCPPL